jgi:hypothetical protein
MNDIPWLVWIIIAAVVLYPLYRGIRRGMAEAESGAQETEGQYISQVGQRTPDGTLLGHALTAPALAKALGDRRLLRFAHGAPHI